jgi:hypothetical protein
LLHILLIDLKAEFKHVRNQSINHTYIMKLQKNL